MLRKKSEWLLIFNNTNNNSDIVAKNILSKSWGNLLITSRNLNLRHLITWKYWKKVEKIKKDNAINLLLKAVFLDKLLTKLQLLIKNIVKELYYLALAIN